jgi:hypothetical protein
MPNLNMQLKAAILFITIKKLANIRATLIILSGKGADLKYRWASLYMYQKLTQKIMLYTLMMNRVSIIPNSLAVR